MPTPPAILALIIAAAGWYYLFYSTAAQRLDGVEPSVANSRRSRLRRINSVTLLLLSLSFYAGFKIDEHRHPRIFISTWVLVMILLLLSVALAVVDIRLTAKLRRRTR